MRKTILLAMAAFLAIALCGCKSSDYKKATQLMQNGEYQKAAETYSTLEDYKDAEERAIMLEVKSLMDRYREFYDEIGSLGLGNYDIELAPLVKIINDFDRLDMSEIAKYSELDKYVQGVNCVNEEILRIIDIDHEAIEKFYGPGFFMFPSSMELSIQQSELIFRSTLKTMLAIDFPYKDMLKGTE